MPQVRPHYTPEPSSHLGSLYNQTLILHSDKKTTCKFNLDTMNIHILYGCTLIRMCTVLTMFSTDETYVFSLLFLLYDNQGGIEEGEDPRAAAIRELREETGVVSAQVIDEVCPFIDCFHPCSVLVEDVRVIFLISFYCRGEQYGMLN